MIIKSFRLPVAAGPGRAASHIFMGDENEEINVVRGTEQDFRDMFSDARRAGRTYAVRHFILAPEVPASREALLELGEALAVEFALDWNAAVVVEHRKQRAVEHVYDRHHHVLLPDWRQNGRVSSTSHSFARAEKHARLFELAHGHPLVAGAHTPAVIRALRAQGNAEAANILEHAFPTTPPRSELTEPERLNHPAGVDLISVRRAVQAAWQSSNDRAGLEQRLLAAGLALTIGRPSENRPVAWMISTTDGEQIGTIAALARATHRAVHKRLGAAHGARNGHADRGETASGSATADPGSSERIADGRSHAERGTVAGGSDRRGSREGGGQPTGDHCEARSPDGLCPVAAGDSDPLIIALRRKRVHLDRLDSLADQIARPVRDRIEDALSAARATAERDLVAWSDVLPIPQGLADARAQQRQREKDLRDAKARRRAAALAFEQAQELRASLWSRVTGRHGVELAKLEEEARHAEQRVTEAELAVQQGEQWLALLQLGYNRQERERRSKIEAAYRSAPQRIATVDRARAMLRHSPALAAWGTPYIWAAAREAMRPDDETVRDYKNRTDMWGIGIVKPPAL